jgi:hypothetical protein
MRLYTVHAAPDDLILVREKVSIVAMIAPLPWLLWHRCWIAALGYGLLVLAVGLVASAAVGAWIGLAVHLLIGVSAQDIRRWTLARQGRPAIAVVAGRDRESALFRLVSERRDLAKGLV